MHEHLKLSDRAADQVKFYVVAEHHGPTHWVEHAARSEKTDYGHHPYHSGAGWSPAWIGVTSRHRTLTAAERALGRWSRYAHQAVAVETRDGHIHTLARHLYLGDLAAYRKVFGHSFLGVAE